MKTREQLKAQIDALNKSIEHWEENVRNSTIENFINGVEIGPDACECCEQWIHEGCIGCPIQEVSGDMCCRNTPYEEAWKLHYYIWDNHVYDDESFSEVLSGTAKADIEKFKAAAQKQLDFLRDIRNALEVKLTSLNS
jgi:hypothetical protein